MRVTEDGVPVQDVIAAVKLAIKEANISATDKNRDLRVSSVKLVLHALATRTAGGGLNFTVPFIGMQVRFGVKVTRSDTHEIEVTLMPPSQESGPEVRDGSLDMALAEAIETVRSVVAEGAGGDDPFALDDARITLSFAVTADGDISIGADVSMTDEVTHTLALALVPVSLRIQNRSRASATRRPSSRSDSPWPGRSRADAPDAGTGHPSGSL
jgi:Trypsin-co-occurring domain 2